MRTTITRAETRRRAELLGVVGYRVEVDLRGAPGEQATFGSRTVIRFRCRVPGESSWVDLLAESLVRARLNGSDLDPEGYDGARLALPGLEHDNELVVEARCRYMTTGEGLHRAIDPADGARYLHTQFATAEARRVFACFEQPDLKAPVTWVVDAPAHWQVVSTSPTPPPQDLGAGAARWQFAPTPPLPTYLAALCAGPFHVERGEYVGEHGRYPLALLVRASAAAHLDAEEFLAITRAGLAHYEREFSVPFPFAKYDQVLLPEFNFGAMENPGVVTFAERVALFRARATRADRQHRAMVILHEMAHMWFGDLVTMRWWDDLWLNESFATWAGYRTTELATPFTGAWTSFALGQKAWAYQQDELPSTHPVAADMVDLDAVYLNFDGITYAKGASVLTQLVAFVGLEAFLAGLNDYFEEHAFANATLTDLLTALSRRSGRDLDLWAQAWLEQSGVTSLRPIVEVDPDGRYRRVVVEQSPAARPQGVSPVLRPHRVAVGLYRWAQGRLVRQERVEVDVLGARAEVPQLVGAPRADLLLVNDGDLTYAKLALDPDSLAVACRSLGRVADPLARALVWESLWEDVRDARLPAQRFLAVSLAALAQEDRTEVIGWAGRALGTAATRFLAPALAPRERAQLCTATGALLDQAEPGSDRQLALARVHLQLAATDERLARLEEVLARGSGWPGLPLDEDLRWAVLQRLAASGHADEALVDQALARDRTSRGMQAAARARAAIPSPAAKQRAWEQAVNGQLPNDLLRATAAGFADPEAPEGLLDPYRPRYFTEIAARFGALSPMQAEALARGLFPPVHPETVAGARQLLADPDLPTGLRRILAEGAAEVERALACRQASAVAG